MEPAPLPHATDSGFRRLFLTLFLGSLLLLQQRIYLPGLDVGAWKSLLRMSASAGASSDGVVSIVALGLVPVWSASLFIELLALAAPALRPLRERQDGRARLERLSVGLALLLALLQGYFLNRWFDAAPAFTSPLFASNGLDAVLLRTLTLAAGTMGLLALGHLISRRGLGNGLSVLLAVPVAAHLPEYLVGVIMASDAPGPAFLARGLLILGTCLLTAWVLRRPSKPGAVPLPLAGIVPFHGATRVLGLLMAWPLVASFLAEGELGTAAEVLLLTAGCLLLAWAWAAGRAARREPSYPRGAVAIAVLQSLAFLYVLFWLARYAAQLDMAFERGPVSRGALDVLGLVTLTAVAMDLLAELRAVREHGPLRAVCRCHRVGDAEALAERLAAAGIAAHPRAIHHRSLWHFFAPLLPIDLLVPSAQVEAARQVLDGGGDAGADRGAACGRRPSG